jgi:predicted small lipoprotein YifL
VKRAIFLEGSLTILLITALVAITGCGEKEKPQGKAEGVSKIEGV